MTLNQPAGHLEDQESLIEAVIRETKEETAWTFQPEALVGIYRWVTPKTAETFFRYCFVGKVKDHAAEQPLDADIHQALWLSYNEIMQRKSDFRSPLVKDCLDDYLAGKRYSLDILRN